MKNGFLAWNGLSVGLLLLLAACGSEVVQSEHVFTGSGGSAGTGGAGATISTGPSGDTGGGPGCVLPPDPPGNCTKFVCAADGTVAVVDDPSDLPPDDGLECTGYVCNGGDLAFSHAPAGTACTMGGKLCDGSGACVECLGDTDCPPNQFCQQGKCHDPVPPGTNKLMCGCNDGTMHTVCASVDCSSGIAMDGICVPLCASAGGLQSTGCLPNSPSCAP